MVVLPEPLGPRNPVTRPGCTVNDRSWTADTLPNLLVRLVTVRTSPLGDIPGAYRSRFRS